MPKNHIYPSLPGLSCFILPAMVLLLAVEAHAQEWRDPTVETSSRVEALIDLLETGEKIDLLSADSPGVPRLDIPPYHWWNEALHGVARNGRATIFPQAINLAATFDDSLVYRAASAISDEARAKFNLSRERGTEGAGQYAGLTFWSPNVNLFRDLRWGRGQETYGEDPFLAGQLGAAFVRGMQGSHPDRLKTAAAAKHFAAHSGPERERSSFNASVSPGDMAESYLPAFRKLVEAGVAGVMCAYNRINGVPACAHEPLLRDTLRGAWGFQGYVVSDCGAVGNIHSYHRFVSSPMKAAAAALGAGVDINCGSAWQEHLRKAMEEGLVGESMLDRALGRALPILFRLGIMDPPGSGPWSELGAEEVAAPGHRSLARKAARESMVLLKNEGVLPLDAELPSLAVMGPGATSAEVLLGNYFGSSGNLSTFLEGITAAVSPATKLIYYPSIDFESGSVAAAGWGISQAQTTEAIVACIGLSPAFEGEGMEAVGDGEAVAELPPHQREWIRALREGYEKPLVVVVTGGSPRAIPEIDEMADAVIWAGYPGEAGGEALADILFGKSNPSGRLPVTVPYATEDLPPFEDYAMEGRTYRYMEKEPLYPFGFGLSYTRFTYSKLRVTASFRVAAGDSLRLSVEVSNTGSRAGGEAVQVYVGGSDSVKKPRRFRLAAFQKVDLQAGERRLLRFSVSPDLLQSISAGGTEMASERTITVYVGAASPLPRSAELGAAKPVRAEVNLK